ncbi:protein kinase domain-containing protein [Glaciecola sp. 1036]|uniref:protein kinase domain-containing protein n=1 Tax=Alteromonadaceae TaxID=72275 RepID=UPI003CFBCA51
MTVPDLFDLERRGIVAAIADGISSSQVSQYASQDAVANFVSDYLLTSDIWSPQRAAQRVLETINTQLYVKTQLSPYQENPNKGYVCTFSALILFGQQAVLLHCGDSAIYRIRQNQVSLCTKAHRQQGEDGNYYLSNALGIRPNLNVDIIIMDIEPDDSFVLMTDGVSEFLEPDDWLAIFNDNKEDLDCCCSMIAQKCLDAGSDDNISLAIINVLSTSDHYPNYSPEGYLPFVKSLESGTLLDNWRVIRELHRSDRSQVFLAQHIDDGKSAVIKIPAISMQANLPYLDEFAKEEWLAKKIKHPQVIRCSNFTSSRSRFYVMLEYIEGKSLRQWIDDNGPASLEQVRDWATQLTNAFTAIHRRGVLHQDIRPDNILIDDEGILTIIDLGAASICGHNFLSSDEQLFIPGDLLFAAPEYFIGIWPNEQADQFSLAVLFYYLLSGEYPFNTKVARQSNYQNMNKLRYISLFERNINVPVWVDSCLKRACQPRANKRYPSLSEFVYDLRHPNPAYRDNLPLIERHPVKFWQSVSGILFVLLIIVLIHYQS